MSVEGSVRERRRAQTIREIKTVALDRLAAHGPSGLSLRQIAKDVGMTVQSLYHYFDSRDALLDELVADAYLELAGHVSASAEATRGRPPGERLIAALGAYREWALHNRAAFLLIFGTPIPGFESEVLDPNGIPAALAMAWPFREVVFDGWTPAELAAVPLLPGAERIAGMADPDAIGLPPGAFALFYDLRGRMHGMVMLEILGHLAPLADLADELYHNMSMRMAADLAALRAA